VPGEPPEQQLIVAAESPDKPTASAKGRSSAPLAEEVRGARRLEADGRHYDAERLLRREAHNGSIAAMEERVSLLRRQGRTREFDRALREAAEAGSARASEAVNRMRRSRRDDDRSS
jgi:hypothetical protein